jgi:DNA end-binding protein Ku
MPMRSMWRGAIQFGLVTIPVRMYLATETHGGLEFHLLHAGTGEGERFRPCLRRIRMQTHCPEHGDITRNEIVRGYEYEKDRYVVIGEEDLEKVPLQTVRAITIDKFVASERGDYATTFVKQVYYLEPEPVGRKAFRLVREVLEDTGLQAVCKVALRDRETLAGIDPFGRTLMLSTLYWPDEVRHAAGLDLPDDDAAPKPAELAMARHLIEAMTGEFDPADYHDAYRDALMEVIQAKIDGKEVTAAEPSAPAKGLEDLMAVLQESVEQARAARRPAASSAPATTKRKPRPTPRSRSAKEPTHTRSRAKSARTTTRAKGRRSTG